MLCEGVQAQVAFWAADGWSNRGRSLHTPARHLNCQTCIPGTGNDISRHEIHQMVRFTDTWGEGGGEGRIFCMSFAGCECQDRV